jgi:multidrug efflux pump subunit AcrA (membrane-fusion protein)
MRRWRARALQSQAELNLDYTSIVAPIDGVVGNRSLRIQPVRAGRHPTMSVVPVASAYVVANFKTQLTDVRKGSRSNRRRHLPRSDRAWTCRQHRAGQRRIRVAAAG